MFLFLSGDENKTPQAPLTHHAASSRANKSQALEVTDNDDEPIGDRWDDEEDWGRLEVGFHDFLMKEKNAKVRVRNMYM